MPIYQAVAFKHEGLGKSTGYDYARTGTPTRDVLEDVLAEVEGGAGASVFSSGLSAIDTLLRLFKPGDHFIVTEDLYGGTMRIMESVYKQYGFSFTYVDTSDTDAVKKIFASKPVQGLFVEVPTNPILKVADVKALGALTKQYGASFIVDSTFISPVNMTPIALGADIVVHSATKYLSGHNDLVMGVLVAKDKEVAAEIKLLQNSIGAIPGPQDCWLLLRSLKTLSIRVKKQQENALAVATFLEKHPAVEEVYYPGLPSSPGHERSKSQSKGHGAMVSFRLKSAEKVPTILERVNVFFFAESLGSAESLVTFPSVQTHADIPAEEQKRLGIDDRLLRLSIGLEDSEDLIEDLHNALQ